MFDANEPERTHEGPDRASGLGLREIENLDAKAAGALEVRDRRRLAATTILVIVLPLLLLSVMFERSHANEAAALAERGERVSATVSGRPRRVDPRMGPDFWSVDYSFTVEGRTYTGHAGMYRVPASLTVVFDPRHPSSHRVVGSLNPNGRERFRVAFLAGTAAVCAWLLWRSRERPSH